MNKREKVLKLFERMQLEDSMATFLEVMKEAAKESYLMNFEDGVAHDEMAEDIDMAFGMLSVQELLQRTVPVFEHNFTDDELERALELYEHPFMATFISKLNELQPTLAIVSQTYTQQKLAELESGFAGEDGGLA